MMLNYDKYAPYVFWCYGIAAVLLIGVAVWSLLRVAAARRKLDAFEKPADSDSSLKGASLKDGALRDSGK